MLVKYHTNTWIHSCKIEHVNRWNWCPSDQPLTPPLWPSYRDSVFFTVVHVPLELFLLRHVDTCISSTCLAVKKPFKNLFVFALKILITFFLLLFLVSSMNWDLLTTCFPTPFLTVSCHLQHCYQLRFLKKILKFILER